MVKLQLPRLVVRHPVLLNVVLLRLVQSAQEHLDDEAQDDEQDPSDDYINDDESLLEPSDEELDYSEQLAAALLDDFEDVARCSHIIDELLVYNNEIDYVAGYGIDDGIWQHTGWKPLPRLLDQIAKMPELRKLLGSLGRRPSSEGPTRRFSGRRRAAVGLLGPLESENGVTVTGLTISNRLHDMLPQEAVLLKSSSPTLRRLFYSRWADSKLQSYERMSYTDATSQKRRRGSKSNLPSASGGPLIICLDTSHSMVPLEHISKAIVVACVGTAHRQRRPCRVVAFASQNSVQDLPDARDLRQLLDWLSSSFVGGGTDVTGALRFVLQNSTDVDNADILLVTDGEIPPVVDSSLLEAIHEQSDWEIHGLNLGAKPSHALDEICTETHTFLMDSQRKQLQGGWGMASILSSRSPTTSLFAKRRKFEDWDEPMPVSTSEVLVIENEQQPYAEKVQDILDKLRVSTEERVRRDLEKLKVSGTMRTKGDRHHPVLRQAIATVAEDLVERGEDARLLVLALLAGEHILLLGPPGTAKSALGRRLSQLCGGPFFQRLLTRFTTPEEIFGPLSLKALENDLYKRRTEGFMPTAKIAFLDEIFKANSAILNALLTILNERQFDNGERQDCPIRCVVAASNELPDTNELEALYDRFLLRKQVDPVSDDGLMELLGLRSPIERTISGYQVTEATLPDSQFASENLEDTIEAINAEAESVTLTNDVCILLRDLRTFLVETYNYSVSDRRLVKAAWLLKIIAASHGRKRVETVDCLILQHIVWEEPQHKETIQTWLWDHITPGKDELASYTALLDSLRQEALLQLRQTGGPMASPGLKSLKTEVSNIEKILLGRAAELVAHTSCLREVDDHLWFSLDQSTALKQLLVPRGEEVFSLFTRLLERNAILRSALSTDELEFPIDDVRLDVLEGIWDAPLPPVSFSDEELSMSMREAKTRLDIDTFRRWKREKKRAAKASSD